MSGPSEARLLLLGWNFRAGEVSVRERMAFNAEEVREALKRFVREGLMTEGVIVATCHRSEIYALMQSGSDESAVTKLVGQWRGVEASTLSAEGFVREGADAARHLFRVASGLESMALGESEVLGQVRQALRLARESGSTRSVLHRLFECALAAGKRVRTETEIAMHPLSVAAIGLELAGKVFGDLSEKTVLVLGAGATGTLFAQQAAQTGARHLLVANRGRERAEALAREISAGVVPWESLGTELARADVVVATTSSPLPVVSAAQVETAMKERRGRPMFFLDLAMPRNVEPGVAQIYNVFAYGLNDLEEVAEENRRRRVREIPIAESILEEELQKFLIWYGNLSVVPTLADWRRRLEILRDAELARQPDADRERLRAFANAIVARLLHEPLRRLKAEPDAAKRLDRVEAIRHLFDLDHES